MIQQRAVITIIRAIFPVIAPIRSPANSADNKMTINLPISLLKPC